MTPDRLDLAARAIAVGMLGLIAGSFANVCIHRLPRRRSVVWPGSACPHCDAPIRWYDNVPVLSWILLTGRCRRCRAPIPAIYPLVESASALLLLALHAQQGLTVRWAALSWLAVSILILVPIDLRHGILPDLVTLPGIGIGLIASAAGPEPGLRGSVLGAAAGALAPLAIRALYGLHARARRARSGQQEQDFRVREGMGLGDVKMLAMVGAFLGVKGVLLTMFLGSVVGTLVVVPMVLAGRQGMKVPVPFGPFLGLGAMVSIFWGDSIIDWYLRFPIPWT